MKDRAGLMNEFGAALQFFDGFGENAAALKECLSYLDEWLPANEYILVISDSLMLLGDMPEELEWFFDVLNDVGEWWSKAIAEGKRFDRSAIPFHVVLQCKERELLRARERFGELEIIKLDIEG